MLLLYMLAQAASAPADPPAVGKELHDSIVSAIRNCPQSHGDEIAVCSKDRGYAERYRIERLQKPMKPESSFQIQLASPETGASGIGSCTATGAGGSTGCSAKDHDAWARWKMQQRAAGHDFPW